MGDFLLDREWNGSVAIVITLGISLETERGEHSIAAPAEKHRAFSPTVVDGKGDVTQGQEVMSGFLTDSPVAKRSKFL